MEHDPVVHDLNEHLRNVSRGEALDAAYEAHMDILCDNGGDFGDVQLELENDDEFADVLKDALKLAREVGFNGRTLCHVSARDERVLSLVRRICWRVILAADVVATREAEKDAETDAQPENH